MCRSPGCKNETFHAALICRRNSVSARETGDFRQDASWALPWMLLEGKEIKLRTIREGLKFNLILLKTASHIH